MADTTERLTHIEDKTDSILKHVDWVTRVLRGDGSSMDPGLLTRFDRMERLSLFCLRFFWIVIAAVVMQAVILSVVAIQWLIKTGAFQK